MLLVFECFEYVFEVDLGRGRRLGAWWFAPESLYLLEVLIELVICTVDVGLFYWGFVA